MASQRSLFLRAGAASALALLAVGCADLNDTGMAALATRVPAFAIVNEQLLQGEMTLFPDHTGTITLRTPAPAGAPGVWNWGAAPNAESAPSLSAGGTSPTNSGSSCVGRLRYASSTLGSIDLRCHDGGVADVRVALIGETRGYGYGQTATGLVSLTFGLKAVEARAHLTVPPGRQLVDRTDGDALELH